MKNILIAGNGPVAKSIAKFADHCDFVIRMNGYRTNGFEDLVGKKTDAYGIYPGRERRNILNSNLAKDWTCISEIWFCRPIFWCFSIETFSYFYGVFRKSKKCEFMDYKLWERLCKRSGGMDLLTKDRDAINRWVMNPLCKDQIGPSTGFSIVQMSICRFSEDNIYISGFSSDPSLGWYWGDNPTQSMRHPWMWECFTISRLIKSGRIMLPH